MKKTTPYTSKVLPSTLAEEAAVQYEPVFALLGGRQALAKQLTVAPDLISISRAGIKISALRPLSRNLGITLEQLSALLHTSHRNLQRKSDTYPLDCHKSEQVLELALLAQRGTEVLGSAEAFKAWLQTPLVALGYETPLHYLDTSFGIRMLQQQLGRLEQGVFA